MRLGSQGELEYALRSRYLAQACPVLNETGRL
ncbi:hypothetical protein AERO9A_190345 [Aeromonas salmonicida]|nr:hypothetical protein AERO9A_190345 [Aeromonas salmonicida]